MSYQIIGNEKNGKRVAEIPNEEVRDIVIYPYIDEKTQDICGKLLLLKNADYRSIKHPEINKKLELLGGRRAFLEVIDGYKKIKTPELITIAALREMQEETRIEMESGTLILGELEDKCNDDKYISHIVKITLKSAGNKLPEIKLDSQKHIGYLWVNLFDEIYKHDPEKREYVLKPDYPLTPRTLAILDLVKKNKHIIMYLPPRMKASSLETK